MVGWDACTANKTTLKDLAKLAGVSLSTVSRALNDLPSISNWRPKRIWDWRENVNIRFDTYATGRLAPPVQLQLSCLALAGGHYPFRTVLSRIACHHR